MSLTWHVLAKDFTRMRIAIFAWIGVLVAKVLFYAAISGVFGAPSLPWLNRLRVGPEVAIRALTEPIIAFIFVAWMVFEDPLTGSDAFWVTRPISGRCLLAAKFIGAALLFVILPIVVNVPWWLSCGFDAGQIARAAIPIAVEYLVVVVLGVGVASVTGSFPRYFLWTIAGLAGVGIVHLAASEISGSGLGFRATQLMGTGLVLTRAIILLLCVLIVAGELAAQQFLTRHFRRSLPVAIALTVVLSAAAFSSSLNFFPNFGWADPTAPRRASSPAPDADISVSLPTGPGRQPSYDGSMSVPMTITGLGPGIAALWQIQAVWSDKKKKIWKTAAYGGYGGQHDLMQQKTESLVGFAPEASDFEFAGIFQFPRQLARKYADKPLGFHADVFLFLLKGAIADDFPVAVGVSRKTGASFSVNNLVRGEHQVTMTVTDRFESQSLLSLLGVVWPRTVTWALVNRDRREMRIGKQEAGSGILGIQLNMVSVVSQKVTIRDIASPDWLKGARLVAFDFAGDHNVERTVDRQPFRFTCVAPKEPRPRTKRAN